MIRDLLYANLVWITCHPDVRRELHDRQHGFLLKLLVCSFAIDFFYALNFIATLTILIFSSQQLKGAISCRVVRWFRAPFLFSNERAEIKQNSVNAIEGQCK